MLTLQRPWPPTRARPAAAAARAWTAGSEWQRGQAGTAMAEWPLAAEVAATRSPPAPKTRRCGRRQPPHPQQRRRQAGQQAAASRGPGCDTAAGLGWASVCHRRTTLGPPRPLPTPPLLPDLQKRWSRCSFPELAAAGSGAVQQYLMPTAAAAAASHALPHRSTHCRHCHCPRQHRRQQSTRCRHHSGSCPPAQTSSRACGRAVRQRLWSRLLQLPPLSAGGWRGRGDVAPPAAAMLRQEGSEHT
jgi:hypothetical protein